MNQLQQYIKECVAEEMTRRYVRGIVAENVHRLAEAGDPRLKKLLQEWDNGSEDSTRKRQVLAMMNQDKVDMAALARSLWPDEDEDSRRSKISKISRGELPMDDDVVSQLYQLLRATHD